jgi:hypothetical protein
VPGEQEEGLMLRRVATSPLPLVLLALAAAGVLLLWQRQQSPVERPQRLAQPPAAVASDPAARRPVPDGPLEGLCRSRHIRVDQLPDLWLIVDKSAFELRVYSGALLLKTYPVSLGRAPHGDKVRRNDGRTPVGAFVVCETAESGEEQGWRQYWMRLNYPLPEDARRGYAQGLITAEQREAIIAAARRGETPPQDTALGGGIGLHVGGIASLTWTQGCIALREEDGAELMRCVRVGTPVTVVE